MTTSYGPVREVMFSPVSNPTDVNSFLIRDDAYARSSAVLGRTLRLGDPIDTGVVSAARQISWTGGRDQNHFDDVSMFQDSDLDTTDSSGAIRFWPSLYPISRGGTETNVSVMTSVIGTSYATNRVYFTNSNGDILSYVPSTNGQTTMAAYAGLTPVKSISLDQTGGNSSDWIVTGFTNGDVRIFQVSSGTTQDRSYSTIAGYDASKVAPIRDMVIYQRKLRVMMGYRLWTVDYSGSLTWVENFSFNKGNGGAAKMAVVNNVLYVLVEENGGKCSLYNSDGVSGANLIHTFENAYPVNLLSHKGALYVHVNENSFDASANPVTAYLNSSLYVYTQSGMNKIYSRTDNSQYFVNKSSSGPSCTWGDYIAISFVSLPRVMNGAWSETLGLIGDNTVGVVLYNPITDSFHVGPTLTMGNVGFGGPPNVRITAMGESNGSLYISLHDGANRVTCTTKKDRRVTSDGWLSGVNDIDTSVSNGQPKRKIVSSSFDAGLPEQNKTWLRVNVKHNLNNYYKGAVYSGTPNTTPTMRVYVSTSTYDYNTNPILIGTYVGTTTMSPNNANSGWITSSFNIPAGIKSTQLKYIIELDWNKTWPNFVDIDSAVIDSVSVEYMVVASPKKVWRTRVLAEDNQLKLSGAANTLTTRSSLVNKLFNYWTNGVPLYYWDASPSTVTPAFTSGVPTNHTGIVMVTDIGENSYRVHDLGSEVNSEVSLTFYEVA